MKFVSGNVKCRNENIRLRIVDQIGCIISWSVNIMTKARKMLFSRKQGGGASDMKLFFISPYDPCAKVWNLLNCVGVKNMEGGKSRGK